MNDIKDHLGIKNNKSLFVASILMLIYSVLEMADSIVVLLMILNVVPNLLLIFNFEVQLIQTLLESQPLSLAPIFWAFTLMRVVSAVGLFKNRLWGFWIGIVSLIITMILSIVFVPFSSFELLACSVIFILLVVGYFKKKPLIELK
ncbi:MAG: hypothetical protein EAX91_16525 [Candidatus Lokiarchaeota archaeon]|nr:hypothetical protein [Candidatus Lokiarchaeota archaeon]